ncbi:DUF3857 domain-containing protein [Wenyingzhuangia marina]|uniref:Transglutaminase-like superfamily protein n=1 Tax=Wenyingzhuangia marina TaxID=1195760 RepID=A0A1M5SQC3_9FLAO|nr:DUF3857 domain-containing protein [Wenyingzhuangia marina]GGF63419.1 hypothetical protein GCM10011397_03060 [Wenyingzhuangia marina]SHH40696.1 Transglutaminase-like superfamily protein [Wenyingzhuangia marina]
MKKLVLLIIMVLGLNNMKAQDRKFGKITKEELKEEVCSIDSIAEAAYLYKTKEVSFEYDKEKGFQKIVKVHDIIKIYNEEGFDYGNQSIRFYAKSNRTEDKLSRIKATTYNLVNGKIEETDVEKKEMYTDENNEYYNYKKIAFPNVKKGSIVELSYELRSVFWDIDDFKIQEEIPIKFIYHSTRIPEYFGFKKSSKGYMSLSPTVENKYNRILFGKGAEISSVDYNEEETIFKGENILALKDDEPFTASYKDYVGTIGYELSYVDFPNSVIEHYSTSWESVCEKLYDYSSFGSQLKKHSYFSEDLEKVIAGKETEQEIVAAVFNFVKSKVTWDKYTGIFTHEGVVDAYKKGTGSVADINLMLVAMLREAGINANPVLSSTKGHGTPLYPTLDGLNYVMAAVESKQGFRILLDASDPYHAINFVPSRAMNWEGRLLYKRGQTFSVPLTKAKKSQENFILNAVFDEDFNLKCSLQSKITDREAFSFRKKYNQLSDDKFKEKLKSDYHMNVVSYEIKNKYNLSKPIMFKAEVEGSEFCETINGKKYINPMLFFKETENPFTLETRKYPVDLVAPYSETRSINITIPKGYKVVSLPKGLHAKMTDNKGSYKYLIQQMGDKIILMSVKEFNTGMILPNQYPELKELYSQMIAKNKEQIVLEKI